VAVFNLGYRPGSDRRIVTRSETTLAALQACCEWLGGKGALSVIAYPGHPAGAEETERIGQWANDRVRCGWRAEWNWAVSRMKCNTLDLIGCWDGNPPIFHCRQK
jgi:hypothetical protein